jgi:hypothetical protein
VVWWPLALGSHELVAQAQMADGTTQTSTPISFSVVEYDEHRESYNQPP